MQTRKKLKPCNKKRFKEKAEAQGALTAARKNSMENEERKENRIYYCRQCHAFHLTSKDRLPFNQNV
jgi:hypothetical protein